MQTTRRDALKALGFLPMLPVSAMTMTSPATGQPAPTLVMVGQLEGVTSITRQWRPGDIERCRLCEVCTAHRPAATCTILTTEAIPDAVAPLYSTRGSDVVA